MSLRRIALPVVLALGLLPFAACVDFFGFPNQNDGNGGFPDPPTANTLGVTIDSPRNAASVASGTIVNIRWSALNRTGDPGSVDIFVRANDDGAETFLAQGLSVNGSTGTVTTDWDTAGFGAGVYSIRARVTANGNSRDAVATGQVTIDAAPTFAFTRPTTNTTLPETDPVELAWSGIDPEGDAQIDLFVDPDDLTTTDNRVQILNDRALNDSEDDEEQTFDWSGRNTSNARVDAGEYRVIAIVDDGVNEPIEVVSTFVITVPDQPDPDELGFTIPEDDDTFLTTDATFGITLGVNRTADALLDVGIDTDDNHANGNEITVLSQRLIPSGTETTSFDWDGNDADGNPVSNVIYRLFFVSSIGTGTPTVDDSEALVFRRDTLTQPLIALQTPATVQTLTPGQFLTITWRDDDPDDNAVIRIVIDDDPNPLEGAETDDPELEILNNRDAGADGVQDTFQFRIPNSLAEGVYYIFAYIDADLATAAPDHTSTAPASFRVDDPATPSN